MASVTSGAVVGLGDVTVHLCIRYRCVFNQYISPYHLFLFGSLLCTLHDNDDVFKNLFLSFKDIKAQVIV